MALRRILVYPDSRLCGKATAIPNVTPEIRALADDMLETMYDAPGIGLAGPQIGIMDRIFVMDCAAKDEDPEPRILINPELIWHSAETGKGEEGCLSIPDQYAQVERFEEIAVRFTDLSGEERELQLDGIRARCAQHEIDHLDGILFIDRISRVKRHIIRRKMEKARKGRADA